LSCLRCEFWWGKLTTVDLAFVYSLTFGLTVAVFIVPVLVMLLLVKFKSSSVSSKWFSVLLLAGLVYGIAVRLVIAPFTGHPQDLDFWTNPLWLLYGSGGIDFWLYPMRLTYYPELLSYSPYALLNVLGFHDVTFLAHNVGVVESLFVKLPFLIGDVFGFYFLVKILQNLDTSSSSKPTKTLAYALLYFLSPVVILSTTAWPLVDGLAIAFFLAGIYYSMLEERPVVGAVFYTLSGITKMFGFIGFVPLVIDLFKRKKLSKLPLIVAIVAGITFLAYLPVINFSGVQSVPDFFVQFLRSRAGFGSQGFLASDSYFSYLSLLGFTIDGSKLTYVFIGMFALVTVYYVFKLVKLNAAEDKTRILELSVLYFMVFFFLFYLVFYKIFDHYYLLVLPLLIIYAYQKKSAGSLFAVVAISVVAAQLFLFGSLVFGAEYYWIPLNLPADTSIIAVIPSAVTAVSFLTVLPFKGRFEIFKSASGFLFSVGVAVWFSFGLAYYGYYQVPFLGAVWYVLSFLIALLGVVFFAKAFRRIHKDS
jgi:uncharacterized membrane protein